MVFGLGKKQETKTDLDANYYERQKAYIQGREEERRKNAAIRGREEAARLANKKPFYQKIIGAGKAIGQDLLAAPPQSGRQRNQQVQPIFRIPDNDPFGFSQPKPRRRKKTAKRKR